MEKFELYEAKTLCGHSNLSEQKFNYDTVEIGVGLSKTKAHLKVGNLTIHNTHHFNWIERKMWKLLLGFDIKNVEED